MPDEDQASKFFNKFSRTIPWNYQHYSEAHCATTVLPMTAYAPGNMKENWSPSLVEK